MHTRHADTFYFAVLTFSKNTAWVSQSANESDLQVESQAVIIFFIWLLRWFILGAKLMSLRDAQTAGKSVCGAHTREWIGVQRRLLESVYGGRKN